MSRRRSPCSPGAGSLPEPIRFAVAGDAYALECDDPALRAHVARWAAPLAGEGADVLRVALRTRGEPALLIGSDTVEPQPFPEDLLPALERLVLQRLVRPSRRLPVGHAAVCAWHGRAALFIGPSGAGKSTLALDLVARGWTYLSDEFAPLWPQGQVQAVPRPVAFTASEVPPELWERLSRGREHWSVEFRAARGGRERALYVLPERRATSGALFPIAALFLLQPRPGQRPRIRRMTGAAGRAWQLAQGV